MRGGETRCACAQPANLQLTVIDNSLGTEARRPYAILSRRDAHDHSLLACLLVQLQRPIGCCRLPRR